MRKGVGQILFQQRSVAGKPLSELVYQVVPGSPDLAAIDDTTRCAQGEHANLQTVRHEFGPRRTVRVFANRRHDFWVGDGKVQVERLSDVGDGCLAVGQCLVLVH